MKKDLIAAAPNPSEFESRSFSRFSRLLRESQRVCQFVVLLYDGIAWVYTSPPSPASPASLFYLTSVSCVQLEVSTASRVAVGAFGLGSGGLGRPLELRLFGFGLFICINYLCRITSIKINKINEALATKSD